MSAPRSLPLGCGTSGDAGWTLGTLTPVGFRVKQPCFGCLPSHVLGVFLCIHVSFHLFCFVLICFVVCCFFLSVLLLFWGVWVGEGVVWCVCVWGGGSNVRLS